MKITCPIERIIANALGAARIDYQHRSMGETYAAEHGISFWLPHPRVFISCTEYTTLRTADKLAFKDIILIQGRAAAEQFARMIAPKEPK